MGDGPKHQQLIASCLSSAHSRQLQRPVMAVSLNCFHVAVLLLWQFTILFATQMLFGIFTTYTPRWRCLVPSAAGGNATSDAGGIHQEDDDEMLLLPFGKDCLVYAGCPQQGGLLQFEPSPFASAAVEFDWICGPAAYYKAFYSQIQFGGVLLGTLLMAPLSDRFGRKPVGLSCLALGLSVLALSSLSPTGLVLLLFRFLVALMMGGTLVVMATFTMELIPPEHRMVLRTFCNWGTSRLWITCMCFLFPDWRSASVVTALSSVPALLILVFIIPESPIWLHSQGKLDKMRSSEQRIARFAGIPYVPVEHVPLVRGLERPNFLLLVCDNTLFSKLLVLWMMWFTSSLSSYSVDLNSSNLSGDFFLNQLLLSCPVMISKMLLFLMDSKWPGFSRRALHQCSQAVVCLCFLLLTAMTLLRYDIPPSAALALNQLGNVFIQFCWDACYLCALESMPTALRSSSLGTCSLVAQFGAILAPMDYALLVLLFGTIFLEFTWDADVLSTVESMPTQLRASALGSCSIMARVGGFFAPLLVFLNERWAASAYLAVVLLGSLNLLVSYGWLVDTKGVDLDAVQFGVDMEKGEKRNGKMEEEDVSEKFLPGKNI